MRKQFISTIENCLENDARLILLLGDIGVFGFRNAFEKFADRVFNIGILEQSSIGLASGLAKMKLIPVVHTIAPFLVERSFEQIKIDCAYQNIAVNLVSVGASYDYASLGCTHHCPADVALLKNIPNIEIVVPGTSSEFNALFSQSYANGNSTYYRLSERENETSQNVIFGVANVIQKGNLATVIAVGPTLLHALPAVKDLDVTLIYYTTIEPFDYTTLKNNVTGNGKILIIEPFYEGTLINDVTKSLEGSYLKIKSIGVPKEFLLKYGKAEEHDLMIGLTSENIRKVLKVFLNE